MIHQRIPLNEHNPEAYLETYFLDYISAYRYSDGAPVILICPGGGFAYLAEREMEPMAMAFNAMGYHVGIVHYSCGKNCDVVAAVADAACAVASIRQRSKDFNIDSENIFVCGFSAGGFVASALGVFWKSRWLKGEMSLRCQDWIGWKPQSSLWKPDGLILGYPVIHPDALTDALPYIENFSMANPQVDEAEYTYEKQGQRYINFSKLEKSWLFGTARLPRTEYEQFCPDLHVNACTPPTFIWHTMQDNLVLPENAMRFASALRKAVVPCELHLFSKGYHGLSLANEVSALRETDIIESCQMWLKLVQCWIEEN